MLTTKHCNKCNTTKSTKLFHNTKLTKDKKSAYCKDCTKAYDVLYRAKNRDKKKRQDKAYSLTEKGKSSHNASTKKWNYNNALKSKAHTLLNNSVRDGKIVKPNKCKECNNETNIQAHHEDYSKPLDVVWLCVSCHKIRHLKEVSYNK